MGMWHRFVCKKCGYAARVSGCDDSGLEVGTTTIECVKCKNLRDVEYASWATGVTIEKPIQCPRAKSHAIRRWNAGDACPRCDGAMEAGEEFCIWD